MRERVWIRGAAAVVSVISGGFWLLFVSTVVRSHLGWTFDPHGYGVIFGTVLSLPAGLVCALALPWAFPVRNAGTISRLGMGVYLAVSATLLVGWFTGS